MAEITQTQLINAGADTDSLALVVNGAFNEGGTGIITTRTGRTIKTLAKVINDLSTLDIGSTAAAAINLRLNKFWISFDQPLTVDRNSAVVRYPSFKLFRNGAAVQTVDPATYSLTSFDLTFSTTNTIAWHYIDTTLIGTSNPFKTVGTSAIPFLADTVIPLGYTSFGRYYSFWTNDVNYTDRPALVSAALVDSPILYDKNNRLGGGQAVYVPLTAVFALYPIDNSVTNTVATNASSTELPGYAKFVVGNNPAASTIFYDKTLNQFTMVVHPTAKPEGDSSSFVAIATFWKNAWSSINGLNIQMYDTSDAQLMARLNPYFVTMFGKVVVDYTARLVRYPRMRITANGGSALNFDPATYSLTSFDLPLSSGTNQEFHYIDVSIVAPTVPTGSSTANAVPSLLKPTLIPLGRSVNLQYSCDWTDEVRWTNRQATVAQVSLTQPILVDRNNRLGGGPAIYVPTSQIYLNIPSEDFSGSITLSNSASTELAGYAKFVMASASPALTTVFLDRTTNLLVMVTHPTLPEGDSQPFIPLVSVRSGIFNSYYGANVQEYDTFLMNNNLWNTALAFDRRIIIDMQNLYGGGQAVYVPRRIYVQRQGTLISNGSVGTESAELAGYVKVPYATGTLPLSALMYDKVSASYYMAYFSTSIDMHDASLDKVWPLMLMWNDAIVSQHNHRLSTNNLQANMCPYGKAADQMPNLFNTTVVSAITETNLVALGFTLGAFDPTNKRPYFGMTLTKQVKNSRAFFRAYFQTDTDNTFSTPSVTLYYSDGTFLRSQLVLERTISARAAIYSLAITTQNKLLNNFLIGTETSAANIGVTGVQFCASESACEHILYDDYPSVSTTVLTGDLAARDATNMALTASQMARLTTTVQRPTASHNTKLVYGQSYARGNEASPSLSRINQFGNLTLGGNVRPSSDDGSTYPTFGSATLQNLIAQGSDGSTLYTWGSEPGSAAAEPPNHGWVNMAKFMWNQALATANDTSRKFVTVNPAVGGKTIEQLSKVNTQDSTIRYNRVIDAINKIQTAVAAASGTHVVDGILFMQGEYNYKDFGGSWDKATYTTLFNNMITNLNADLTTITSQPLPPAMFIYQAGSTWTNDADSAGNPGLHVGMAQWEVCKANPNVFMVGPTYQLPDKNSHLCSNSSRWFGNQVAKVYDRVVRRGLNWVPLSPRRVTVDQNTIIIDFHVPVPPLKFDNAYVGRTATMYAKKGFRVTDAAGEVTINTVEIVGNTMVRLTLSRYLSGQGYVWYACKTTYNGAGNLCDSDATIAYDKYVYAPADGMAADENITALVDKPYPLNNWAIAFYLPVGFTE